MDPKPPIDETTPVDAGASKQLETEYGSEGAEAIGAEHDGPIKAPDADGGAYVIP